MAPTNAVNLANFASGDTLTVDLANDRVGIGSTLPTATLDVAGIVSATSFIGDGSQLQGVSAAGLGTAIDTDTAPLDVIYYTNKELFINDTTTINVPDSADAGYTQYQEVVLGSGVDLIIEDGDDFIPDILGIGTEVQSPGLLAGGGGRIRADNLTDKNGGAPTFPNGFISSGVGTFSSDVKIAGVLTYEDVTNIDSVGIITAQSGVRITGGELTVVGTAFTVGQTGVVTATSFHGDGSGLSGVESWNQFDTWLYGG